MNYEPVGLQHVNVDEVTPVTVGPGCTRYDLPGRSGMRAWIVDIEAGAAWPHVDRHDELGEDVFVVSGEMIEGEARYGAGTFLHFGPNSSHRPRSEKGVRLFGVNLTRSPQEA